MKTAAVYCRVSTEDQEREGSSLDSQLEACLRKGQELGYDVNEEHLIKEVYSGLTLDRPKLTELRHLVKRKEVGAVIAYTLDRVSRDPIHCIIIQEEFEKTGVDLVLVTETLDSSDLGKLITHIKGYAAKLEAEKIKERTMRGIRERVKAGRMPSGRRARLYGYTYVPGKGVGEGIRYINENEAMWVREMFRWLAEEGMTLNGITYRLRALSVPTPSGDGYWIRSTVYRILMNPAYTGTTYCFTHVHKETDRHCKDVRKHKKTAIEIKPYEEGVQIEGATPAIVESELFEAAQARLKQNKSQPNKDGKVKYLLRGHLYCSRCGRKYWGYCRWEGGKPTSDRRYYCMGRRAIITPDKCDNTGYKADLLESIVWEKVEKVLLQPELIVAELKRTKEEAKGQAHCEQRAKAVETALTGLEARMDKLAHAFVLGLPEGQFKRELDGLKREKADLEAQKAELQRRVKQAKEAEVDAEGVEKFCELARRNLRTFGYEQRRLALEALRVKVWIDGGKVAIEGAIPVAHSAAESTRLA